MRFKTAIEYIEYLDEQSGESWSNATNELADVMEDYAKMYHEHKLKLLGIADVVVPKGTLCVVCEKRKAGYGLHFCSECWEEEKA